MDINKEFEKLAEEFEKERHDGHEPQGIDDQYVEEMEDEEVEEARTYIDRKYEKKKKGLVPQSQKKKRWGSGGYGKGEEVEEDEEDEAYGGTKKWKKGQNKMKKAGIALHKKDRFSGYVEKVEETEIGEKTYYNLERGVYEMGKEKHDRRKEVKQGYPNAIEVKSTVKQAAATVAKLNKEEVEIDELVAPGKKSATGYILYHKDFSSAMQHAYDHAKKKGHVVDPKEIDDKVATGPKKPSKGKVNRYALKAGRKTVQIQVTNLDNKAYELNMYIEGVEPIPEGFKDLPPHLQKLVKKIEKKQKDWNKQNPEAKIQTLVYNPETGKPDIVVKETMKLEDTIKQVVMGEHKGDKPHKHPHEDEVKKEDSDKDEPGTQGDMKKYQAARAKVMKKFGVKSCSELEGDEKKACYAALDAAHVSDDEEEKGEKKEEIKKTFSKMFTHVKSLMQGK